jgi:hypothetical protein
MSEKQKMFEHRLEVRKQLEKEKESMMKNFFKAQKNIEVKSETPKDQFLKSPKKPKKPKKKIGAISSRVSTGFSPNVGNFNTPGHHATREKMKSEARKVLDGLKKKSKKALTKLIKEEEKREAERDEILSTVTSEIERKRLEKIFEIERAKVREQQAMLENKYQEDYEKVNGLYEEFD